MFSARSRLAFGLTTTVISVVLIAMNIGIMPDYRDVAMHGRVAVVRSDCRQQFRGGTSARYPSTADGARAGRERNEDILSAAVRREDGSLAVEVGDHELNWKLLEDYASTDTQVMVPIRASNEVGAPWNWLSSRLHRQVGCGTFHGPPTQFVTFIGAVTFLICSIYLARHCSISTHRRWCQVEFVRHSIPGGRSVGAGQPTSASCWPTNRLPRSLANLRRS